MVSTQVRVKFIVIYVIGKNIIMKIINNPNFLALTLFVFLFLSVLAHGREDPNDEGSDQLELAACTKQIDEVCGEKPILLPGETSAHKSCVLESIENIDDKCQGMLEGERGRNRIDVRTLPNLVQ